MFHRPLLNHLNHVPLVNLNSLFSTVTDSLPTIVYYVCLQITRFSFKQIFFTEDMLSINLILKYNLDNIRNNCWNSRKHMTLLLIAETF